MPLLTPRLMLGKMIDITPELLRSLDISALLLDIDNTMTTHDNPVPAPGVTEWIARMQSEGFKLVVVSNNSEERVSLDKRPRLAALPHFPTVFLASVPEAHQPPLRTCNITQSTC